SSTAAASTTRAISRIWLSGMERFPWLMHLGAWAVEIFRAAKASAWSIFPPILDPWNHHGSANRRKSVLTQPLFRLGSFYRPRSSVRRAVSPAASGLSRRRCRSGASWAEVSRENTMEHVHDY